MRILVDTALLLNDFFFRRPEVATLRGGPEPTPALEQTWQQSHEALLALSLQQNTHVCMAEYSSLRLATILSDLRLPANEVLDELRYWNANFRLLALSAGEAEHALETGLALRPNSTRPAEDHLLAHLALRYEADYVLAPLPRPDEPIQVPFKTPAQVLIDLGIGAKPASDQPRNTQ